MLPAQVGRVGMHEALPRYARQFGPVCKAFFGRYPIVVITDADLVKQVRGRPLHPRSDSHRLGSLPPAACRCVRVL